MATGVEAVDGTVLHAGRDSIRIRLKPVPNTPSACGSCACRPWRLGLSASASSDSLEFPAQAQGLQPDDSVHLVMPEGRLVALAALFYLIPLLTMLAATLMASRFAGSDAALALSAFAGLGLGSALSARVLRGKRAARFLPGLHRASSLARISLQERLPVASAARSFHETA